MAVPRLDLEHSLLDWSPPAKKIHSSADVQSFLHSVAIDRIKTALMLICQKVSLKTVPEGVLDSSLVESPNEPVSSTLLDLPPPTTEFDQKTLSPNVQRVLDFLAELNLLMDQVPPLPGPRRYGNMACRDWHDQFEKKVDGWFDLHLRPLFESQVDGQFSGFVSEARYYILGAFGSRDRLDYGTGHELSFLAFFASLLMCQLLDQDSLEGTEILIIFGEYYDLVKRLILTYTLEPAGSHGVWGLDDHFHLIYIIGASQLVDSETVGTDRKSARAVNFRMGLTPSTVLNPAVTKQQAHRNLFYNAIGFIRRVKKGNFSEHSPLLYEICTSKPWEKIALGMIKMFQGEVLSKFTVVQHFYFGNVLFPWKDAVSLRALPESSPDTESEKTAPAKTDYRSEAELAMHSLYQRREEELAMLAEKRPSAVPRATRAPWK
ncbi:hypothetical protein KL938_002305 [Ogataea parapolymorpha]|nr:hypothetical protein KL938_002305 [Ogataea parapolymorpha]